MKKTVKKKAERKNSKTAEVSIAKTIEPITGLFPIVCIGASAGGLEAFELFLGNVIENSGMAYVVIQHLDPTQKGMLPELLQRVSKIKVFQVKDKMVVKPNCIYVIPPNKSMSILKGTLYLMEPLEIRGLRLPIDFFMRSLADDRRELSVGVILSGMGSDGSIGLGAIKEKKGIVLVQEPSTAKFDSMPRNAIDSVLADIVAPAEDLPSKLVSFLKYHPLVQSKPEVDIKDISAIEKIIHLLHSYTGNDLSFYKKSTIYRRIERRMGVHKIDKIALYVNFLQENPKEVEILFKEIMIGVTNFFRDPLVWENIGNVHLTELISKLPGGSGLRAWVPACSTGEEAYTIAITFKETLEKIKPHKRISLQIFATDIDNDAIEIARKGIFPVNIMKDVSNERLIRFFTKTDDGYRINNEIREMVVFAQHNLIMHPPFTKIDIISCRNLLIYLEPELQKKILSLFNFSLNHNGFLILGSSETVGTLNHSYSTLDSKFKIYKRSINALDRDLINFPSSYSKSNTNIEIQADTITPTNIQTLADQLLLSHYSPASVLVNDKGDIIYINGRTGKYLEPAAGKANMNIFAMLRDGLRNEFTFAFHQAIRKQGSTIIHNAKVNTYGTTQTLNINIHWVEKPEPLYGTVMIIFNDVPTIPGFKLKTKTDKIPSSNNRETELEKELQNTREEMQNSVEEMQASQEELKSANEELQSANEELQSTNEELTSSKEEMQSLNEELQTVNIELLSKVDDFSRVDNDMKNLLNSTDIATLFLDKELNIRRYTIQATKIFKLIKSDIGRPFTDQMTDIIYPGMADDALEVLRTLIFIEKQIPSKDGRWFSVRIMPYRTYDDRIDGLVITFINITELKRVEEELHETDLIQQFVLNSSSDVIIKLSPDLKIIEFNAEAEKFFASRQQDVIEKNFIQTFVAEPERKNTEKLLKRLLLKVTDGKIKTQVIAANGDDPNVEWSVKTLYNKLNVPNGIILKKEAKI